MNFIEFLIIDESTKHFLNRKYLCDIIESQGYSENSDRNIEGILSTGMSWR